ncbi:MAG: flavodoxin-dependent (E)-4-hydroxy-3-methylbut-2-enyl-diphosphate synthase, partial [bacterium]|nr:flavodoxin-dependent (E)-4-hydroxy-3-methylbut-2-enyl-diphosphate synthase [bacterium]
GIGAILALGIGDTIRVSLTANPIEEIRVARVILASLNLSRQNMTIISCPTCGRTSGDLIEIAREVELKLEHLAEVPIKIAIMGCSVNGPGEAKEADLGIALTNGKAVFFQRGEPIALMAISDAVDRLIQASEQLANEYREKEFI